MRLTADLVKQAPAYMNPLGERELNLRGFKIPAIENLGATEDQYQVIDLSDNEILKIENFPLLSKLTTLILNNNRIEKIDQIAQFTPKIDALILTNNRLTNLTDLDPLSQFKSLRTLSLLHNPVTRSNNYRLYVIFLIPSLRILDFAKIKQKEREAAKTMFASLAATREQEAAAAKEKAVAEQRAQEAKHLKTLIPGAGQSLGRANLITEEQRQKIMAKIEAATSLAEIEKLENILKTGQYDEKNEMLDI